VKVANHACSKDSHKKPLSIHYKYTHKLVYQMSSKRYHK